MSDLFLFRSSFGFELGRGDTLAFPFYLRSSKLLIVMYLHNSLWCGCLGALTGLHSFLHFLLSILSLTPKYKEFLGTNFSLCSFVPISLFLESTKPVDYFHPQPCPSEQRCNTLHNLFQNRITGWSLTLFQLQLVLSQQVHLSIIYVHLIKSHNVNCLLELTT